jgi:hypothetical protein
VYQEFLQKDIPSVQENAFCSDTLTWHQQQHIILQIFCSPSTGEWERNQPQNMLRHIKTLSNSTIGFKKKVAERKRVSDILLFTPLWMANII